MIAGHGLTLVPSVPVPGTSRPQARTSSWHAMAMARVSCSSRRSATRANRLTLITGTPGTSTGARTASWSQPGRMARLPRPSRSGAPSPDRPPPPPNWPPAHESWASAAGPGPSRFPPRRVRARRQASRVPPRDPETVPPRRCPNRLPEPSPAPRTRPASSRTPATPLSRTSSTGTPSMQGQPADVRDEAEGALELLLAEWGPDVPPDEQAFYACSPHRIQACASILRDSCEPELGRSGAAPAARLDPMVRLEDRPRRRGCRRALAAARAEAAILASETHAITEDEAPFRQTEYAARYRSPSANRHPTPT